MVLVTTESLVLRKTDLAMSDTRSRGVMYPSSVSRTVDAVVVQGPPDSHILAGLRFATRCVWQTVKEGRIGQIPHPERLNEAFLISACESINDANRQVLQLESNDTEGLQEAFRFYEEGSTFISSALIGHMTNPLTVPASFFGAWAYAKKYDNEPPSVPWFVVAVALAWARCVGRMWTTKVGDRNLAQEVRSTFQELALHSGNQSLVELLQGVSDDDLRLSIDHLLKGAEPRNSLDRSIQDTLDWASRQLPRLPHNVTAELSAMEKSLVRALQLAMSPTGKASYEDFSGLEFIGPIRLVARMSSTIETPTDKTHARAMAKLHERVLEQMRRSVEASVAAKETNKLLALHREDVWMGTVGMLPTTRNQWGTPPSEHASSYHPSTMQGSLAAERATDFVDDAVYDDEDEEDEEQMEGDDSDFDETLEKAVQERERAYTIEHAVGLAPASNELEPLEFDDSRSTYTASSLSGFPNKWTSEAPSIASSQSVSIPVTQVIGAHLRDPGPSLMPTAQILEMTDEERSVYEPSVLSGLSVLRSSMSASEPRPLLIPAARISEIADEQRSVYNPSVLSSFSVPRSSGTIPTPVPFSSLYCHEQHEEIDPVETGSVATSKSQGEDISQWVDRASALTNEQRMFFQEGAATAALMEDNQTLGQKLSAHRAGESDLVVKLSQAHSELGHANTLLVEREDAIVQLKQRLEKEREEHRNNVEHLRQDLQLQSKTAEELRTALQVSQAREEEHTKRQEKSAQAIEHLSQELENKTKDAANLQLEGQDLIGRYEQQSEAITQLTQTLEEERQKNEHEVQQLQWALQSQAKTAEELQSALQTSRAQANELVNTMQGESSQIIEKLTQDMESKKTLLEALQREGVDLTAANERMKVQLEASTVELQQINQQSRTAIEERDRLQNQVLKMGDDAAQREIAIAELDENLKRIVENKEMLESEIKKSTEERARLEEAFQDLNHTRHTEMIQLEDLTRKNKDLEDTLKIVKSQLTTLERSVAADREGNQLKRREKDNELLESEEARRKLLQALQEVRLEADEAEQALEELQPVILQLRQAVGMTEDQTQTTMTTPSDRIREVMATIREQHEEMEKSFREAVRMAEKAGVDHNETSSTTNLIQKVQEWIDEHLHKTLDTQRSLVELLNEMGGTRDSKIATRPSAELVRLAQARFAEVEAMASAGGRALVELTTVMGLGDEENPSWKDIIARVSRTNADNKNMRQGLQEMSGTVATTPSSELVQLTQEKFQALAGRAAESSSEVVSLRQRIDLLQTSVDKERVDRESQRKRHLKEIDLLKSEVTRMGSQHLKESQRRNEDEDELRNCRALLAMKVQDLDALSKELQLAKEMLTQRDTDCLQQLEIANEAAQERERLTDTLKQRIRELDQASIDRDAVEVKNKTANERKEKALQKEILDWQGKTQIVQQELDQMTDRHHLLQEEVLRERAQWDVQLDSFNRQLQQAAPGEAVTLRLERDQLVRDLSGLEAQLQQLLEVQSERDRLSALNEQLTARLWECEGDIRLQSDLLTELRQQVATLELAAAATTPLGTTLDIDFAENELEEDEIFRMNSSSEELLPEPTEQEQHLNDLGKLIAQQELQLVRLEIKVEDYKTQLADLVEQIENAEATLAQLYDNIECADHTIPSVDNSSVHTETPPTSPVFPFPSLNLDQWMQRFPTIKPLFHGNVTRRWVLAVDDNGTGKMTCNVNLLNTLLDPRMQFLHREQLENIVQQTVAFVDDLGGASSERRRQRNKCLRGFDNLQRLAVRARKYVGDRAFRLATVCEFVIPDDNNSIRYHGAVLQRYCELIVELSMVVTFRWRVSAMQQRQRLIFTEGYLMANDPTAVVVRFMGSPFQTFDRQLLFQSLLPILIDAVQGNTLLVPVLPDQPSWAPQDCLVCDFEEAVPDSAPALWVKQQLDKAAILVPGLVHVSADETIAGMKEDLTYVQIARLGLDHADGNDDCVLLVGQQGSWIVVDPLLPDVGDVPEMIGRNIVGAIQEPRGVTRSSDRGFALMTWIREVFVHGMPIDKVLFRGQQDREQCVLEQYFGCLFHP